MESIKTLMISAAVCVAMALPVSGLAQVIIQDAKAFIVVKGIVCGITNNTNLPEDESTCMDIKKYMYVNGIASEQ